MDQHKVTVAYCSQCGLTGVLTTQYDRPWCSRCQAWATVTFETIRNAMIESEIEPPRLMRSPGEDYPLQPLRIPQGWTVAYNVRMCEIDAFDESVPRSDRLEYFDEDILQMRHEQRDRLLDVGWYPAGNLEEGAYKLVVYEGDFSGTLLHEFRGRDRLELVDEIERLLEKITRGLL